MRPHRAGFLRRTVATSAFSKVTAENGQAGAKPVSGAPCKTAFAKVAVSLDGAPASTGKVEAILSHPQARPWESHRLQLQLPAPVPALLLPLRTRRVRRQK